MTRTFDDKPATRSGGVPLLLGLMGPSGGGKTYSALRLATGIQRVSGGDIFVIDTETRRALHYADRFRFRHVEFDPPYASLDYLAAAEHCVSKGAKVLIIDSMSHEHEGVGGMLDQHDDAIARGKKDPSAWIEPKKARRRMISALSQMDCNVLFCFRAEEKNRYEKGQQPQAMGFVPIAGKQLIFEMTACALLLPNAGGVPTWQSREIGERLMIKRPQQFDELLSGRERPLDEDMGEAMARWAAGDSNQAHAELVAAITDAASLDALEALVPRLKSARGGLVTADEFRSLNELFRARKKSLRGGSDSEASSPTAASEPDTRDPDNPEDY